MKKDMQKALEGKTQLIIVNSPSSAGFLKVEKYGLTGADKIGVLHVGFYFDAYPFPTKYEDSDIALLATKGPYKSNEWAVSSLRDFLSVDLHSFDRITVWYGNSTSEKMFLYFFARYYGRPFYVMNFGVYGDDDRPVLLDMMRNPRASDLIGKEAMISEEELQRLQRKAEDIISGDTGFHAMSKEGEVVNVLPDTYTGILYEIIEKHGGPIKISNLIGQMMGTYLPFCSEEFDNKLIAWHLKQGLLKATWVKDGKEIKPEEQYPDYTSIELQFPGPYEFAYRNILIDRVPLGR